MVYTDISYKVDFSQGFFFFLKNKKALENTNEISDLSISFWKKGVEQDILKFILVY